MGEIHKSVANGITASSDVCSLQDISETHKYQIMEHGWQKVNIVNRVMSVEDFEML